MKLKRLAGLSLAALMIWGAAGTQALAMTYIPGGTADSCVTAGTAATGSRTLGIKLDPGSRAYENMTVLQFPEGTVLRPRKGLGEKTAVYELAPWETLKVQYPFREVTVVPGVLYRFETGPRGGDSLRVVFAECDANENAVIPGVFIYDEPEFAGGYGLPFADVPEGYWAGPHIRQVWDRKLMQGTSKTTFSPEAGLTRAALWTMLARMEGVEDGREVYYENAREFVMEQEIADGRNPHAYVTRQEFAAMLYRYWQYAELEPVVYNDAMKLQPGEPGRNITWDQVRDREAVAEYAREAVEWAVTSGVFSGDSSGCLRPDAPLTRAHVAKMMDRFLTVWHEAMDEKLPLPQEDTLW